VTLLSGRLREVLPLCGNVAFAFVHAAGDDHAFGLPVAWCVTVVAAYPLRRLPTIPQHVFAHRNQGMAGSQRDLPLLPTYRWA